MSLLLLFSQGVNASAALTEANDSVVSTATVLVSASSTITEAADSVASTATVLVSASAAITEAADSIAATSAVAVQAAASIAEAGDTLDATVADGCFILMANGTSKLLKTNATDRLLLIDCIRATTTRKRRPTLFIANVGRLMN